jgi:hypothetical protein
MPWPHYEVVAPEIIGVATKGGHPLSDVVVHFNVNKPYSERECRESRIKTSTTTAGEFYFEAVKEFEAVVSVGDRFFGWAVCFDVDGELVLGWGRSEVGYSYPKVELICELKDPEKNTPGGSSRCNAKDV